ncbi:hypothetical protein SEA_MCGALLEON_9 [Microbacterium phage McGalleon]|uniref:Uncharacterized protein n=1 Tax=Microbacterium phage McGalleon TaxID=2590936 RepID=A0A516KQT9_9CAUD|nr:hypothetical protein H3N88_gp09 [Microbacterium phage McGalleon]QDP44061.1 hypothetical protein SEA_MCGALLEON_9 [Microbacterium phage McGalleon]
MAEGCTDCGQDPVSDTEGAGVIDEQPTPEGEYDHQPTEGEGVVDEQETPEGDYDADQPQG